MCVSVCVIFENYLAADNCCAFTVSVFIFLLDEKSDEGFFGLKGRLIVVLAEYFIVCSTAVLRSYYSGRLVAAAFYSCCQSIALIAASTQLTHSVMYLSCTYYILSSTHKHSFTQKEKKIPPGKEEIT